MKWISVFMTAWLCIASSVAVAHDHTRDAAGLAAGPHGGGLSAVHNFQFEVVLESQTLRIYIFDERGSPVDARSVRGAAIMKFEGNPKEHRYNLYPESSRDREANCLSLAIHPSRTRGKTTARFMIQDLTNDRATLTFSQTLQPGPDAEQSAIAEQRVCPVSGQALGSMGKPVKTAVGGRTVFVCCESCIERLERDPAVYLARLPEPAPRKASQEDVSRIAKQRVCPVMDEPLDATGTPWKVVVKGREVFVCCKQCVKKVQEQPDAYIARVEKLRQPVK